jgi:hypothetical protein
MDERGLMDVMILTRRIGNLLYETLDLSDQLAQALDRNDPVSVKLLVSMRGVPIRNLKATEQELRALRDKILDENERQHLTDLLGGAGEAANDRERALKAQAGSNARQLQQLRAIDERINRRVTREKSIYR